MKFCKNLQRVVDLSDPEWAPYFINYKMLKKLIKDLPSLVPDDSPHTHVAHQPVAAPCPKRRRRSLFPTSSRQIKTSPAEVAFFKSLHFELKKATRFFGEAEHEFVIRAGRIYEGIEIMKMADANLVQDRWCVISKSLYRLYRDLLLFETFAIMAYCSFSKILKKHDKVTGYSTRMAFMRNVVSKANFTNYPNILVMINRCSILYEEVFTHLLSEVKYKLLEDECLFIDTINKLNEEILGSSDDSDDSEYCIFANRKRKPHAISDVASRSSSLESEPKGNNDNLYVDPLNAKRGVHGSSV